MGVTGHPAYFLPVCSLLRPSILDLRSGTSRQHPSAPSVHYAPPHHVGAGDKLKRQVSLKQPQRPSFRSLSFAAPRYQHNKSTASRQARSGWSVQGRVGRRKTTGAQTLRVSAVKVSVLWGTRCAAARCVNHWFTHSHSQGFQSPVYLTHLTMNNIRCSGRWQVG